jgi:uncharacterized repeat protein (TIGR03833 family)
MQRPRNRQRRPPRQNSGARGGYLGGRQNPQSLPPQVPTTEMVRNGVFVSIVLKIDQPTGREVQGVVADVLTSGDHPRGIKVRLTDGRVGRVQRMVSEEEAKAGSAGLSNLGRNGETLNGTDALTSSTPMGSRVCPNVRVTEELEEPTSSYSLEAFLPAGHPLRDGPANTFASDSINTTEGSTAQVCPVCGQFEGDEIAVSHHVASHFD